MMIDSARYPRLARIQTPDDLRTFDESELRAVADELRAYLIESVGKSGGHFAAGLGVIELTVALHYLYQTPVDQLVWDVGHQTYPHKILTGRRDQIHTVKQKDGVAPFPKREESEYDTFGVGHSSTSISAALGMAIARQTEGDDRKVVAVIGDGDYLMGVTAFWTAAHARLPLLVIVVNNRSFFNDELHQERVARERGRPVENRWIGQRIDDMGQTQQGRRSFKPKRALDHAELVRHEAFRHDA